MGTFEEEFGGRLYREDDWDHYPSCYNCRRYTVFMFYLDDIAKARAIYPDVHQGELILCSECVPTQAEYERLFPGERAYREDSILNNREIFELLDDYCYNVPTFGKYAHLDRLILTSNVMLKEGYKRLLKKPLPKTKKIKVLMSMFPRIHRFRNRKYASGREVIEAVKAKCNEIRSHYRNLPEAEASRYHDQYDVMLHATPRHQRPSQILMAPQEPVDPVLEVEQHPALNVTNGTADATMSSANNSLDVMRLAAGSDASDDSIQISSESLPAHNVTQGTQIAGNVSSSQSLAHISSQSISGENHIFSSQGTQPTASQQQQQPGTSQSQPAASQELDSSGEREAEGYVSSSQSFAHISSQSISGENHIFSSQGTQPTASQQQQQQPGTSQPQPMSISAEEVAVASQGPLDTSSDSSASSDHTRRKRRSAESATSVEDLRPGPSRRKRARPETPMNPSPEEFVRNPSVARLPRTDGG